MFRCVKLKHLVYLKKFLFCPQVPPKETQIKIDPSASVSVGTNVTLTCKSKANPSNNMTFSWHKRGQDNQLDLGEQLIFTVNRSSGGWYFCIAKNENGIQRSEEIQLIMEGELNFYVQILNVI